MKFTFHLIYDTFDSQSYRINRQRSDFHVVDIRTRDLIFEVFRFQQANALGASLSSTQLTHIYASPLLRAYSTAEYVQYHQNYPMPSIKTNPHLREQYYGIAEGHPWVAQPPDSDVPLELLYEKAIFPVLHDRDAKFPESESLNDLASRAEKGIRECVLPHLQESQFPEVAHSDIHIAIASHGRCIGELLSALLRLDPEAERDLKFTKLANTAWTRMYVRIRVSLNLKVNSTISDRLIYREIGWTSWPC